MAPKSSARSTINLYKFCSLLEDPLETRYAFQHRTFLIINSSFSGRSAAIVKIDSGITFTSHPKNITITCGRIIEIKAWVRSLPVASELLGDHKGDQYRERINDMIDEL